MKMRFIHANIYHTEEKVFRLGTLLTEDDKIIAIAEDGTDGGTDSADITVDLSGRYLIPGLVDAHTHGRAGHDFASATVEEMIKMKKSYADAGSTTVFATVASAPYEDMVEAVKRVKEAGYLGVHIEGRYFAQTRRGAHNPALLTDAKPEELAAFFKAADGMPVYISVDPLVDKNFAFIKEAKKNGAVVSIGHTDADYDTAMKAMEAGATTYTHLYNCMPPIQHRNPGCITAALTTDAYTEIISDGFHLDPPIIKLTQLAKDGGHLVLITDSMAAAGCCDGEYSIAGIPVIVKDGKALNTEGHIAGSTISMYQGLTRFAKFCGLSFEEALPYATENPAKMLGIDNCVGKIAPGMKADLLVLEKERGELVIRDVYVDGHRLHN